MASTLSTLRPSDSASGAEALQRASAGAAPPAKIRIPSILVSQSGQVAMNDPWAPLLPGLSDLLGKGYFKELVLTGLDQSGVHPKRHFSIDDKGVLDPFTNDGPLGSAYKYRLDLVGKDGARYTAVIDVTPETTHVRHSGYDELHGLELSRVDPPPPPPPSEVRVPSILISQSGYVVPKDPFSKAPFVAGAPDGYFKELTITGLDASGVHPTRAYQIDADGRLHGIGTGGPLGDYAYQLTLVGKDGARYVANVDVSSSKTGVRHSGYDTLENLRFRRVSAEPTTGGVPLDPGTKALLRAGPKQAPKATVEGSPQFRFLSRSWDRAVE